MTLKTKTFLLVLAALVPLLLAAAVHAPPATILTVVLAALPGLLIGGYIARRTARDLGHFHQTMQGLIVATRSGEVSEGRTGPTTLAALERIPADSEIGRLAATFRTLCRELAHALRALRQSESEWQRTFDSVQEGIIILDRNQRVTRINHAASELLNLHREDIAGRFCNGLIHRDGCTPDNCPAVMLMLAGKGVKGELSTLGADDVLEITSSPLADADGTVIGTVHLLHDLSSQFQAVKRAQHLSDFDSLTELPNRDQFLRILQSTLEQVRARAGIAGVLLLDLDHFLAVNESLGHAAGDQLVRAVGQRLASTVGRALPVARLGGDEFAVILPELEEHAAAMAVAEEILEAFRQPFLIDGHTLFATFTIGLAFYPEHGLDGGTLIKNADIAMYHAKQHGRNTYRVFTGAMSENALARLRLGTNLRHALERNEFEVYFQPSIRIEDMTISGFEALLRWHNLDLGEIVPDQFIPLAEENGLILPIGRWVLRAACLQGRAWMDAGNPAVRIAVNLSGLQLKQDDLVDTVAAILQETGFPPELLELELTETVLMKNPEATAAKLHQLKELGLHIALDDFGTGYSSLNYLKRFPLDRLKIDRSFVRDLAQSADDASIVEVIISIAHTLGMTVTAEGVESVEQLEFLRENLCNEVQGFFFSPPVPAAEARKLLARADFTAHVA